MCYQDDNIVEMKKGQVLNDVDFGKIEAKLDEGWNCAQIAHYIGKDASGIRREVKKFSIIKMPGINYKKECKNCVNQKVCEKSKLCDDMGCITRNCKGCMIAPEVCKEYKPVIACKYLKGHKKVCNGCPRYSKCSKPKKIYIARLSSEKHSENRLNSRKKEKGIGKEDYLEAISIRIKMGQSPEVAINTMPDTFDIKISVPTVYSYIDKGLLSCNNLDLRNKVKRKPKREKKKVVYKIKHRANGRSYHDLPDISKEEDSLGNMQMDVVEGVKGGKVLLTLLENSTNFLIALPMEEKNQNSVKNEIDQLEDVLKSDFKRMFNTLLTDNGSEFLNFEKIETSKDGRKRTSVYYADPYASYQKGSIENQHRLIRYFFPKSVDFGLYNDDLIIAQINKINNYPRKELGWKSPYQILCTKIAPTILEQLGFYYIPIENLNMRTKYAA
jgi:transposase, IS30 family